jgi:tellurite resistance protein TerC
VPIKQALAWSIAWVTVAMLFAGGLWLYLQQTAGLALANQKPWNIWQVIYWKNH